MGTAIDRLKAALEKHPKVQAWDIRRTRTRAVQSYLVGTKLETERSVEGDEHRFTVQVRHDDVQGQASLRILPGEEGAIGKRVDEAAYMASLGGVAPFDLCGASPLPAVELMDPALGDERRLATSRRMSEEWCAAAAEAKDGARPSSGELFLEAAEVTAENSAGFRASEERSRISLLTIMLAKRGEREAERVVWDERRRTSDLDLRTIVHEAADEARDLTDAELPRSGKFAVVIAAVEFGALFGPVVQQGSGESLYAEQTRFEPGQPLPIQGSGGDPFTLASNPTLPFGLDSYSFDGDGAPARRVEIVRSGTFVGPWVAKRYADYTKRPLTGAFGNLELQPGALPLEELLRDGPVLYVHRFSWLTPDNMRGDFASEIRLGYWCEKGTCKPVKGGSVAGNLFASLGQARFSKETVFLGDYFGPKAVRFEGLTVTGA